jgi:TRAP-type C4-dicarboxylate transport system substrate-binding protein
MKFTAREMRTRASAATTVLMSFVIPISASAAEDKTYVMKLSTATINDVQHEWMKRFVAAVEKDSSGRIKGEIYPASQLGSIPRQIEGTQFGSIQGWIFSQWFRFSSAPSGSTSTSAMFWTSRTSQFATTHLEQRIVGGALSA